MCLSCGRGDTNFPPTGNHIRGGDGKMYKSDMYAKGLGKVGLKDDPYNYGFEVFNRLEVVKEHNSN